MGREQLSKLQPEKALDSKVQKKQWEGELGLTYGVDLSRRRSTSGVPTNTSSRTSLTSST